MSGTTVGRLTDLRRYPVKSLVGEALERVEVDARGLRGDRLWCVRDPDGKLGSGKSSRRFRAMDGLLSLRARYDGDVPVIDLPDGRAVRGDDAGVHDALSALVGRPVTLSHEAEVSHFDDGPVHLVTAASLAALGDALGEPVEVRRFRPNLVVDTGGAPGYEEDTWLGRRVAVGEVVLGIEAFMPRCVMVTMPQVGLAAEPRLLHTVTAANDGHLGVLAEVLVPGSVAVGDDVRLLP